MLAFLVSWTWRYAFLPPGVRRNEERNSDCEYKVSISEEKNVLTYEKKRTKNLRSPTKLFWCQIGYLTSRIYCALGGAARRDHSKTRETSSGVQGLTAAAAVCAVWRRGAVQSLDKCPGCWQFQHKFDRPGTEKSSVVPSSSS